MGCRRRTGTRKPIEDRVVDQTIEALSAPHIVQSVWDRIRQLRPEISEPEIVLPMRIQVTGAPVARERRDGGQIKRSTFIPLKVRKRGASKVVVWPDGQVEAAGEITTQHDQPLRVALTRAFYWQQLLDDGGVARGSDIAQREGPHHSTVNELLRLTLREPAIIQAILTDKQPRCMGLMRFQRNPLPTDWMAQREVLVRFDA